MAHRDDHQAALARAAALTRELTRERKRAIAAERRAVAAERRATAAEQARVPQRTPVQRLADRSQVGEPRGGGGGAYVLLVLLLVLLASIGIVVGVLHVVREPARDAPAASGPPPGPAR
ncbi:MAG: hypothetical protein IPL61_31840 [Myxococcales bacterium]|nr:hypothetical protein [Myxococcales bacterium]